MNLRQLEIFRAVVRYRSTVAAAEALGMSQPAVSNALKSIETSLGFLLFERANKRMTPTPEAMILLNEAEPLFRMQEVINQTAAHLRSGKKGLLRVAATSELSESLLPRVISRFWCGHEGIELSLETQRLDTIMEQVESGMVDLGLAMEPHPRATLEITPLARLGMVCACHENSPLAALGQVRPADIAGQTMINARTSSRILGLVLEAFRAESAPYQPAMDVRFMNVAGHFVEEGLGVTIMDELTASSARFMKLRAIPFLPRVEIELSAIIQLNRSHHVLIQSFLFHIRAEIASRGIAVPDPRTRQG
ncbi:LysR family transcriptional regulator [Paracoccus caeni]|uniref:LysR family transcriptional regulator n=1 Tax=Paracoccus caeni TaxID=657651 RepID=A0A934SI45_9RHOB|nr:LysR substrate-binding domain-containing protein [Paracoccus caeni]MBK4217899.1 LysR family transcriptional regulator [Paracoccus caeni]